MASLNLGRSKKHLTTGLGSLAFLAFVAIPAVFVAPGCQGRECESDGFHDYGLGPNEGHLVDENTWESTPNNATWLAFGPYTTWVFHPAGLEGRDFLLTQVYFSADPDPNSPGKNYALAAGNSATIGGDTDGRALFVNNDTCAPTYLRVVIVADPKPPAASLDGGVGAVGGEGGLDAGNDAGDILDAGDAGD